MSTFEGKLEHGLKIGETVHKDFALREASAGDIIDSSVESERMMETPRGPALISSPALAEMHLLRRQIKSIGSHEGPLTLQLLKMLSHEDLQILRKAAEKLEKAAQVSEQKAVGERGRGDPPAEDD